jgi:hypothetical protein
MLASYLVPPIIQRVGNPFYSAVFSGLGTRLPFPPGPVFPLSLTLLRGLSNGNALITTLPARLRDVMSAFLTKIGSSVSCSSFDSHSSTRYEQRQLLGFLLKMNCNGADGCEQLEKFRTNPHHVVSIDDFRRGTDSYQLAEENLKLSNLLQQFDLHRSS